MINKNKITNYWFKIEPYVHIGISKNSALLYNTLDGVTIESYKADVIELLRESIQKINCGVVFLSANRYNNENIKLFIQELRKKYMGDIIDVNLSIDKPIQIMPYSIYWNQTIPNIYKKQNFSTIDNILKILTELCIQVDQSSNIQKLKSFIQSVPEHLIFNIAGNINDMPNHNQLFSFLDQHHSYKNILCSYTNVIFLESTFENNFSYKISVDFPIDMHQWNHIWQLMNKQTFPYEYIFEVTSIKDCSEAELIIKEFNINKYRIKPVYTGNNIRFFEDNIFITKEDILSSHLSIKDFFENQAINIYDFGKINIMPNGDAYANVNHPVLGNIYTQSLYEIVQKEIEEGQSWFRIRSQSPCCDCVYQWLCPSPSDYEIVIGRPNLCHIK